MARWAAAGQAHNTLVRVGSQLHTDRGVQLAATGSVHVLLFPNDLFLFKVIRDVHHGGPVQRFCIVNNMDCDQRGQHFIYVVYVLRGAVATAAACAAAGESGH